MTERQQRMKGTFDPVPPEVQKAADKYVELKRSKQKFLEKETAAKELLIAAMIEHNIERVDIDDAEKELVLFDDKTVKIKSKKEPKDKLEPAGDLAEAIG